jgi:hypothetical protein
VLVLVVSLVVGLALGYASGGRLENLQNARLALPWLIFVALALQFAIFSPIGHHLPSGAVMAVHLASYALVIVFAALNLRSAGIVVAACGTVANAVVIAANGGYMPARRAALSAAGVLYSGDIANNSRLIDGGTRLSFLGDLFAVPKAVPLANVFSIGDLLIAAGVAILLASAMRARPAEG